MVRVWCSLHHSFNRDCKACVEADYARLEATLERYEDDAHAEAAHAACVSLAVSQQAQVARLEARIALLWGEKATLEAANAALVAALREVGERVSHEDCLSWEGGDCNCIVSRVDAALSDAGKGWLEMREQVRAEIKVGLKAWTAWGMRKHLKAALDALGET